MMTHCQIGKNEPEEQSHGVTVVVVAVKVAITVTGTVTACAVARRVNATNVLMATGRQRVRCRSCPKSRSRDCAAL